MNQLEFLEGWTPEDFGLDLDEYPSFRTDPLNGQEVQLEAIEFVIYCQKWVAAARIPTGIGKMLVAWCAHKATGLRTAVLTATKGLQDQYGEKLGRYGAFDIRGKSNYQCAHYNNLNCRGGASMGCPLVGDGCTYDGFKARAKTEMFQVTNYQYWMTVNHKAHGLQRYGQDAEVHGANPIELLIMDEAHCAFDQLSSYLGFELNEGDIKNYCDPKHMGDSWSDWKTMALGALEEIKAEIRTTGMELAYLGQHATHSQVRVLHQLEERLQKFESIYSMGDSGDWVLEMQIGTRMGRQWNFDVVRPGRYARQYLFCNVPKAIMMTATLNTKDLGLLNLTPDDYDFRAWRRIFPVNNCPVYYCPPMIKSSAGKDVAVKIVRSTNEEHKRLWVRHMDDMIQSRLDRRIVLITSSYKYQEYIMEHSRYAHWMLGNRAGGEGGTAMDKFEEFIASEPPTILCSPSFGEGWDFSFERCEFLILSKVPLRMPGGASKLMAARLERDPEYGDNETMRDVVQVSGRPQRDNKDTGEVVIADGSWGWFGFRNQHLAPVGFVKDIRKVTKLPQAPKSIKERKRTINQYE